MKMRLVESLFKTVLPPWARRSLRTHHRRWVLNRSVRQFRGGLATEHVPTELLRDFIYGWGNESWTASAEYAQACVQHGQQARGAILECGSGLSTMLLGLVAERTGNRVYTLEHQPVWANRVRAALDQYNIRNVEIVTAPLRDFGAFDWYDDAFMQDIAPSIALVVCDGPPSATKGGRYGLLPVMRERMQPGCVVLLDDAARKEEMRILKTWQREFGIRFAMDGTQKPYAVVLWQGDVPFAVAESR